MTKARGATQPLAGVRVVNLGWIWAAPALAGAMADMGADVIKIETARRVDNTRRSGALYKDIELLNHSSLTLLRGQRSITLDLANTGSRDVALEIIAASDVVVENYRPGTVARWASTTNRCAAPGPMSSCSRSPPAGRPAR